MWPIQRRHMRLQAALEHRAMGAGLAADDAHRQIADAVVKAVERV